MTDDTLSDVDALAPVRAALVQRYARHVSASVFVEDASRLDLRYSDGAVHDLTRSEHGGSAVRLTDARGGSSFRATGARDADEVLRAVHGDPPRTPRGRPSRPDELAEPAAELLTLLATIDASARRTAAVEQVLVDAELVRRRIAVVTRDDVLSDVRTLVYLTVRAVARNGSRTATGFMTPATSGAVGALDGERIGETVARRSATSLHARPAPIAHLPVVVGPGRGIVLIHEACCHPLEGDEVLLGSVHAGRLGERIGAEGLTILDDPTIPSAVGSYAFDDEGVATSATRVVEDGRLSSYLLDRSSAAALRATSTGNGRVDSFRSPVIPRMSNTSVAPGPWTPAEIIADTPRGIYAENVGGGEVVESTGEFVFRVLDGFLIEDGRLTDPIEETTVSGQGASVLAGIDRVGDDVALGAAKCGKFGQFVPVGVHGPTLRIDSLLVGGTQR